MKKETGVVVVSLPENEVESLMKELLNKGYTVERDYVDEEPVKTLYGANLIYGLNTEDLHWAIQENLSDKEYEELTQEQIQKIADEVADQFGEYVGGTTCLNELVGEIIDEI